MRKLMGFLLLSSLALVGCGGSGSSVTTGGGGGGGGGPLASYNALDQVGYIFDPASKVGVCTTGMVAFALNSINFRATPGAALTTLPGAAGGTAHGDFRNGRIVGDTKALSGGSITGYTARIWTSLTAAGVNLPKTAAFPNTQALSINNAGAIVGRGTSSLSATFTNLYWSSSTATPVTLPGTGDPEITDSGHILYLNNGQLSIAPNATTAPVAVPVPAGYSAFSAAIRSNNGDVYFTAYNGSWVGAASAVRPFRIDLNTRALSPVQTLAGAKFELVCAANGWLGGTDRTTDRPILIRNGVLNYVDDLITEGTGEVFNSVVGIFNDGSIVLLGEKNGTNSHFIVPAGRIGAQ